MLYWSKRRVQSLSKGKKAKFLVLKLYKLKALVQSLIGKLWETLNEFLTPANVWFQLF